MFVQLRARRPDALFVMAGEGPAREHLVKLARELGIFESTRFIGYLDRRTDLPNCYAAGDAFVFASRTETQGLVLLEAMAQGTPVVSTAELGTKFVLKDGAGALVMPERVEEFSAAVVRVLEDPGLHAMLSESGREYSLTWSSLTLAQRLADVYRSIVGVGALRQSTLSRTPRVRKLERGFICAKLPDVSRLDSGSTHDGGQTRIDR
jgi:1,2-diacylglycerol 3-alpha-glucosyltransferase